MFIKCELDIPASSVAQLNEAVDHATRPHEGIQKIIKLLEAIQGGMLDGSVKVAVSNVTQALTAAGGGTSATYDLK